MVKDAVIAKGWQHLNELLFENSWNNSINRFRSNYVFRGLSDEKYSLLTSLNRICGKHLELEVNLLRNFKKYSSVSLENNDFWKLLSVAQHHGLPTRLLDWTYSPYVALHFATANIDKYDTDGAIWCVDFVAVQEILPQELKEVLADEAAHSFTTDMLGKTINNFDDLDKIKSNDDDYVIFFEPPSIDSRIVNQFALFSIMSNSGTILSDWLYEHDSYYKKIILPKELKWEVRDKLDQLNITERVIYPGLDGLCKWLERHYTYREV